MSTVVTVEEPLLNEDVSQSASYKSDSTHKNFEKCDLTFESVSYTVPLGKGKSRSIVSGISGSCLGGEVLAILGPTGSGKSTLLDVLANRKDETGVTGRILVNGRPRTSFFQRQSAYVVQEDVAMGTLSVRENLAFSAALRLSSTVYSEREKRERVDDVVETLGLQKCQSRLVGTKMIRGVSGGEKKRLCVGMELVTQPSILFLDEPTSGLDASTANDLMQTLGELARAGHTIVLSIHQPRYSIFKHFTKLLLLSQGRTVFFGTPFAALHHFSSILQRPCESFNNPADHYLDVIVAAEKQERLNRLKHRERDGGGENGAEENVDDEELKRMMNDKSITLIPCPTNSLTLAYSDLSIESSSSSSSSSSSDVVTPTTVTETGALYATSFLTQIAIVSQRTVRNVVRNPQTTVLQVVVMLVFGVIVGLIYLQLGYSQASLQNRVGAIFFIIMNLVFGNLSAIELFLSERVIFVHEKSSGYYHPLAYFLSKVFCDMLPLRIIPSVVFGAVTYWMMGFQLDASKFFVFLLTLILTSMSAASLCFMFSSMVSVLAIANLMVAMCYVFFMVFAGLLLNVNSIPIYFSWLEYISIFKYSYHALVTSELRGLVLSCTDAEIAEQRCFATGEAYIASLSLESWDVAVDWAALTAMIVCYLSVAGIMLQRMKRK